ncbi:hypothetical protein KQ302_10465 [Synechococcus sp. CS-602]|uniref:hypothetical protein n=1 Tax=Synechococcaceae TaxID=1890426 RepID=UPI0011A72CA6|nr:MULTISPECIES: hypothetical protein [Synechococcaceae]MCT4365754.1 hypothetical protein [Candidatus Regnicoccus frigidus MAG-AL1]MCT0201926.1 hypothetical protein [Synechococcus sp. CS-603]MCT0205518.1 hypothetical protein [Synechococcus sp. CS-602]MCT0246945.1 hypothetical protein [Synechococcus sp. CS-601]MCT4366474.1 hypothetical protein [Candidatus Regnicoccus frigidus MAG-AL2]
MSARKVARQAPVLAGLHRVADGLLLALGGSMIGLSVLTLHWQGAWTKSFQQLEASQTLEHRLQESTSQLEQHHLAMARRPGQLVPTTIKNLIHLPPVPERAIEVSQPVSLQAVAPSAEQTVEQIIPLIRPGY